MASSIRVGGSWRTIQNANIRTGGSWKQVKKIWVKTGGSWQQVFTAADPAPVWTAGTSASATNPSGATAIVAINSGGSIGLTVGTNGSWLPSGATNSNYRVKWVKTGGTTPTPSSGWSSNSWAALSSTRSLSLTAPINSTATCTVDITIEEINGGGSITKSVSMSADSTSVLG